MLKSFLLALSIAVAAGSLMISISAPSLAQSSDSGSTTPQQPSSQTETFATKAASDNQFEIESSRLAVDKVQNREIRRFAQQMIDDHTKAGSMMREVAAREGINLPQTPELSPKHVEMARNVEGAGSGQFDRIYMDAQVAAHQETVELFRDYAQSGDNANIRDFAQTILPTLENHLTEAQNLRCAQVGAAD